jgi:cobaltochelatase CobN
MHLLQAQAGVVADGSEPVDLGQEPADILILSAADTELANLSAAAGSFGDDLPSLRLANLMQLSHNLSVDLYADRVVSRAKMVMVRLLGGVGYWPYGVEQLSAVCRERDIPLALLPGDDQPDAELARLSTLPGEACHRLWQYCVHGGPDNARHLLAYAASLVGRDLDWQEPKPLLRAGLYWPGRDRPSLEDLRAEWRESAPVAAIVFYRALLQASNLAPIDALIAALRRAGVNPLPVYCASLKEPLSAETVASLLAEAGPGIVLNGTGFAVSSPGAARQQTPFDGAGCPVLQVVFSGGTEADWAAGTRGLSARDIAMNVALPEVDGRILSRAVSFKTEARYDQRTQAPIVAYQAVADRIDFVAELAAKWLRLADTPPAERQVAIVLANYPNRDGRLGNGVGLDTPAGTMELLRALAEAGYETGELPADGQALIERLAAGPTNSLKDRRDRQAGERYALADYEAAFAALPAEVREAVTARWGAPEADSFVEAGAFVLSTFRLGHIVIGLQPARGYNIDPQASYHDPDLVPPHGYFAFYAWLRREVGGHLRAAAPPLSLHRQRPGRGQSGQAPGPGGDRRPPDAAADPRRVLRAPRGARVAGRRILRGGRCRSQTSQILTGTNSRSGSKDRAGQGLRHFQRRCGRRRALEARQLPLRAEGDADPRRPAHLRPRARGRSTDRPAGGADPTAAG